MGVSTSTGWSIPVTAHIHDSDNGATPISVAAAPLYPSEQLPEAPARQRPRRRPKQTSLQTPDGPASSDKPRVGRRSRDRPHHDDDLDAFDIPTVCRRSGLGRSYVYEAIGRGELVARKFGRLTRVLRVDFEAWLKAAPPIAPVDGRVPLPTDPAKEDRHPAPPALSTGGSHRRKPDRTAKNSPKNSEPGTAP